MTEHIEFEITTLMYQIYRVNSNLARNNTSANEDGGGIWIQMLNYLKPITRAYWARLICRLIGRV